MTRRVEKREGAGPAAEGRSAPRSEDAKDADAPEHGAWRAPAQLPECLPWYTRDGHEALRSGKVGDTLYFYRAFHNMTQAQLSEVIDVDRTTISKYEKGRRTLRDVEERRRLADKLQIPYAALGVDSTIQQDHAEMLASGESVVCLAQTAREQGRAADALRELDRLVKVLEARARNGKATRGDMMLLASARAEVGVALGDLLPEAHLASAAHWAGSGVQVVKSLEGEPRLAAHALGMYGNELRKAGKLGRAVKALQSAIELSPDTRTRATASLLLARAASVGGHAAMLDRCVEQCRRALEEDPSVSNFFINPFSLREVELRGLLLTNRRGRAERIAGRAVGAGTPPPTWAVMERVTMAQLYMATGETEAAAAEVRAVIPEARALRLPHQVERAVRLAESAHLYDLAQDGKSAVEAMSDPLRNEEA